MKNTFNAWITPAGRFVSCDEMGHEDWAHEWFNQHYFECAFTEKNRIAGSLGNYTEALHNLGFIRISQGTIVNKKGVCSDVELSRIPKRQLNTIEEWAILNNEVINTVL